jgi:signal transduction histidine kinase
MRSLWRRLARALGLTPSAADAETPFDRQSAEVLARIAHELRQPLAAARTAFGLIRVCPDDSRRERACVILDRQFARLAQLFDDLLETSRLRATSTILRIERIDLRRVVEEMADAVRADTVEKQQHLTVELPDSPIWMEGDVTRLQQVVSNLLVNGIKFTDPGGRVSIHLECTAADAVLTVHDTGRGIKPDLLPHIFEPFIKDEASAEDGLGVGLAITRQLVELHRGTVSASSAGPGNGSEFVVTLPMSAQTRAAAPANLPVRRAS